MTLKSTMFRRTDGRACGEMRALLITTDVARYAEGSALIRLGNTEVFCTASVEERVPAWKKGKGGGWVTAEYSMLPRATKERTRRESTIGKQGGRTLEIQRLISRSLRSVIDLNILGERQITVDCDVLQADGGTRCAAITGGYVALAGAVAGLMKSGTLKRNPLQGMVAAVSVGVMSGAVLLDLAYAEDSVAEVDSNIVMTDRGQFVEIQSTAEGATFDLSQLEAMLELARVGLDDIFQVQRSAISGG